MTAASKLVDQNVRQDFLIIGGAALVRYGSLRKTEDVDIAINAKTLNVLMEKAATDLRFKQDPAAGWTYTCQEEGIEGLEFGDVYLASLADIVLMKAHAYQDRVEEDDLEDMMFALRLMGQKGETFQKYHFKSSDMTVINDVAKGDEEMKNLLTLVTE